MARIRAAFALAALVTLTGCLDLTIGALNAFSGSDAVTEVEDLRYGDAPRQTYDLYTPEGADGSEPLIVYIHGGSWYDGSKDIYRFLGTAFGDARIEVAVINYTVAPEANFPSFPQEAAMAVAHFLEERPDQPVFVMGHSAGAQMAALVAYDPKYLDAEGAASCELAGFIGVSGPYDFLPLVEQRFIDIFPTDLLLESQPINYAEGAKPPSLLIHSRDDRTVHVQDTELMTAALQEAGQRVETIYYEDAGHIQIISAISRFLQDRADTFEDVVAFIRAEEAAGYPGCSFN